MNDNTSNRNIHIKDNPRIFSQIFLKVQGFFIKNQHF
jgi:hypothetical protein